MRRHRAAPQRLDRRAILAAGLAGILGAGRDSAAVGAGLPSGGSPPGSTPLPPELVRIRAGTAVGDAAPDGWSCLVVKSIPRLASGDLDTLPSGAAETATLFRTVFAVRLADSDGKDGPSALVRVGLALCMPHRGRDVVVTADRLDALGIELGPITRLVLGRAEAELVRGRLIIATPGFALLRCPAVMVVAGEHAAVDLHYAMLAGSAGECVRTLCWSAPSVADPGFAPAELRALAPDLVFGCPLDVRARRILGAVPVSWSFAMNDLPPGRRIPCDGPLRTALAAWHAGRLAAERLEAALRRLADTT